jgi:hypothetical protein
MTVQNGANRARPAWRHLRWPPGVMPDGGLPLPLRERLLVVLARLAG